MLLLAELAHDAAEQIYPAILPFWGRRGEGESCWPILRPYDAPARPASWISTPPARCYQTDPRNAMFRTSWRTGDWEQKVAQSLEEMDEVLCYVKNYQLGFTIPYTFNGQEHGYITDYIIELDDDHGPDDPLHLILEVSGEARKDKAAKVAAARNLWIPAVNNYGGWGRWKFIEIVDPWDAKNTIRKFVAGKQVDGVGPLFEKESRNACP